MMVCQDRLSKAFYPLPRIDYWHNSNHREGYQMTKFCKKCGDTKPTTEFYKHPNTRDGLLPNCKTCTKAVAAARYAANPEKVAAISAKWRDANLEKVIAAAVKWRAANRDKVIASCAKWRAANREKAKAYYVAWYAANPNSSRIKYQNRRVRKIGKLSKGLAGKLFKLQRGKCACGCKQPLGTDYHLDHIMPLALGGTNTDDNIQLLRASCNHKKHAKHPIDFMQQRGFLL